MTRDPRHARDEAERQADRQRRRGVVRTALVLGIIAAAIYIAFIASGMMRA